MNYHKNIASSASEILRSIEASQQGAYWSAYRKLYSDIAHDLMRYKTYVEHSKDDMLKVFIRFCLMSKGGFSQLAQDYFVLWALNQLERGYFVEVGAGDGTTLSNTKFLEEEYGWNGLLVEPNPTQADVAASGRRAELDRRCVFSKSGERVEFTRARVPELSRISGSPRDLRDEESLRDPIDTISCETISLTDLFSTHKVPSDFDYFSLDIEGYEFEVMVTFPFKTHHPRIITSEHNFGARQREMDQLLSDHGYVRIFQEFSRFDGWYIDKQQMALLQKGCA